MYNFFQCYMHIYTMKCFALLSNKTVFILNNENEGLYVQLRTKEL